MAKINDLKNSFGSSRRKVELSPEDIERIAQGVETPAPTPPPPIAPPAPAPEPVAVPKEEPEALIKTSLDFPVSLYEDMKITLFKRRQSMKDYIWDLVRQDLYKNK